jgi:hypothetical protein
MNPIPIITSGAMTSVDPYDNQRVERQQLHQWSAGARQRSAVSTTFNSGGQRRQLPDDPGNLDLQVLNPSPDPATSAA